MYMNIDIYIYILQASTIDFHFKNSILVAEDSVLRLDPIAVKTIKMLRICQMNPDIYHILPAA